MARTGEEQAARRFAYWYANVAKIVNAHRDIPLNDEEESMLKGLYDSGLDEYEAAERLLNPETMGHPGATMEPMATIMEKPSMRISRAKLAEVVKGVLEAAKTKNNPWAICTASGAREDKEKYERCVKDVKKQPGMKSETIDVSEALARLKRNK